VANKDLKTRTPIANSVNTAIWTELKDYSKETDIPLSKLLDRAIKLLLESANK